MTNPDEPDPPDADDDYETPWREPETTEDEDQELIRQSTLSDALTDENQREQLRLPDGDDARLDVIVELNLLHQGGLDGAVEHFRELYKQLPRDDHPSQVANTYMACRLTMHEIRAVIRLDEERDEPSERAIYRVWPDFPVRPLIDRSVATIKADAARRSYEASGVGITWAVIDSGIANKHPHFSDHHNLEGEVWTLHHDFTGRKSPLTDEYGHGTHVAGIIAGGLGEREARVAHKVADESTGKGRFARREVADARRLTGTAPQCKLVSLKVLDKRGRSRSMQILQALQYIRENVNGHGKLLRIHGVNLSVGYEFDAEWFACGQSPLCVEVDRLVKSGVVVVVAAGNTGYGSQTSAVGRAKTGLTLTINDPGNAALAITVGATHRDAPHTYGVSYFSSKGPTGDGRLKPDLVAPGERITSCAAGRRLPQIEQLFGAVPNGAHSQPHDQRVVREPEPPPSELEVGYYIDESGTSMAAPHVSGAIAAFLSIRQEFINRPEEVKRIFLENATSLGRERYFEGHGMVDLMRAIQAV